jgi:HK97 family phage portal protein
MNPLGIFRRKLITAASRALQADVQAHHVTQGIGADWTPTSYGEYQPASVPVYAAIRVRAEAMGRTPWGLFQETTGEEIIPLPETHPLTQTFAQPNPWFTGKELIRATETYLCLWGKAFWAIEPSETTGRLELWPLRPDRVEVLPGQGPRDPYIRGYRYRGLDRDVLYLPEEIEFFRYFNPLQDRTGLSPIAPLRLTLDMGRDALRYNRSTFKNGGIPDYLLMAADTLTEAQVQDFYARWEARFSGPDKAHRPAFVSGITDAKILAFSSREMEFIEGMRWTVKDVARVYGVPETMLAELQFATMANMEVLERWFWRSTIIPEATMLADRITASLLPKLGFPAHRLAFDFTGIEALSEGEDQRLKRETEFLNQGVLTVNEVRHFRGLQDVAWGNEPRPRQPTATLPQPSTPVRNGHTPETSQNRS